MTANCLNITGLILNLIGVLILFRYGMPFRVRRTRDEIPVVSLNVDHSRLKMDLRYEKLGYLGLALIIIGTFGQIGAVILSS